MCPFWICGPDWQRTVTKGKVTVEFNNEMSMEEFKSACDSVGYSIETMKDLHDLYYRDVHESGDKLYLELDYKNNAHVIYLNSLIHQDFCVLCDNDQVNIQCKRCYIGAHKHCYQLEMSFDEDWLCPDCNSENDDDDEEIVQMRKMIKRRMSGSNKNYTGKKSKKNNKKKKKKRKRSRNNEKIKIAGIYTNI